MKYDNVENPKHYADGCSVECIDMMQTALGWEGVIYFCLGNAYKYLWRHKLKNNPEEDLHKAKWYIDRAVVMAQDDPDSYGYLLSMAEPLMQLVETYTILLQSKKALNDLDDSSFYPDCLITYNFEKKVKEGLCGNLTKEDKESKDDEKIEPASWWKNKFEEDDWMFVRADAKIVENRVECVDGIGYINPDNFRTIRQALKRIIERSEKYRRSDS